MSHPARFVLSIPNAGTDTPAVSTLMSKGAARSTFGNSRNISVTSPAALTGACTIQVSPKYASGIWATLQVNGADVAIAAGKSVSVPTGAYEDIRIHSAGAEAAQRDFQVVFQVALGE